MDEFKFVLKCFLFASLLMTLSQVKTENITYEAKIENFLTQSQTAYFLQEAAQGGAKLIKKASATAKAFVTEKMDSTNTEKQK